MIDFASLTEPLAEESPCGPDLDLEGDDTFLNYVAGAEGRLPASFFAFSRDSLDIKSELQSIADLLGRTRDIRLLALAAKFSILNGDLVGFADAVESVDKLLVQYWNEIHPRDTDGDFSLRRVQIESLDDMATAALPLQYAPLVRHRRHGVVSLRSHFIAIGEVQPREGDTVLDTASIRDALMTIEDLDGLKRTYDAARRLERAIGSIQEYYQEQTGYAESLSVERLPVLAQKIRELIEEPLRERDPAAVPVSPAAEADAAEAADAGGVGATGEAAPAAPAATAGRSAVRLDSLDKAVSALRAAERYFAGREPSNPCILLLRQAQQLVGKSFIEAMQLLVPSKVDSAAVNLGGPQALTIPMAQLGSFMASDGPLPNGAAGDGKADGMSAETRLQAVDLIEAAERFFIENEPSSPVPLLLARARSWVNRDFSSLLNEFTAPPQ